MQRHRPAGPRARGAPMDSDATNAPRPVRQTDSEGQIQGAARAPDAELAPLHPLRLASEAPEAAGEEMQGASVADIEPPSRPGALPRPLHCEWAWRPDPWGKAIHPSHGEAVADATTIGEAASLHHDARGAAVGFAQQDQPGQPASHGLRIDAPGFDGSFVSLAIALPQSARAALRQRHLVGLWLVVTAPEQTQLSARLNILFGPNTGKLVRNIPADLRAADGSLIEFDLAYCPFQERLLSHLWCDIILSAPVPDSVTLHDVAFTLRPRAEI